MNNIIEDLESLFAEAKQKSEFNFILTLINYRGISTPKLDTNLHEWFDAIDFYKRLYDSYTSKEKTRMGLLLYSTFFENSDFYNIIGSLCKNILGYQGSSYLYWKTRKYERLLGIGEKQDFLIELLEDTGKQNIIRFFSENHYKEIRNTFFHSSYSLSNEDYIFHDSEPMMVRGRKEYGFNIELFFYPLVENVYQFFNRFKQLYLQSFDSYNENKEITGRFPNPVRITILGSKEGLQGFKIPNATQFYGKYHDAGIWYMPDDDMWAAHNIMWYTENIETIEIDEQLKRYESKADINKSDTEFYNILEKIKERQDKREIARVLLLLEKFGDIRSQKMSDEANPHKKASFPKIILPYYEKALELGSPHFDMGRITSKVAVLKAL